MASKKFNEILNFNPLYVMFFVPFLFNILNYSQNGFFLHDTLGYYERFKYLVEYLSEFKDFPLWVNHFFYGKYNLACDRSYQNWKPIKKFQNSKFIICSLYSLQQQLIPQLELLTI